MVEGIISGVEFPGVLQVQALIKEVIEFTLILLRFCSTSREHSDQREERDEIYQLLKHPIILVNLIILILFRYDRIPRLPAPYHPTSPRVPNPHGYERL